MAPSPGTRKGPISVGVLAVDLSKALGAAGIDNPEGEGQLAVWRSVVNGLNKNGGLAGRTIEPVYYEVDGSATSFDSESQAACANFTQDHHVEAVVSFGFANTVLTTCLLRAGVPHITGDQTPGTDEVGLRQLPNLFAPFGLATDRATAALIDESVRTGWLSNQRKLGVVLAGCPDTQRTYDKVVVPLARRYGFPVQQAAVSCTKGSEDLASHARDVQSAALSFRTAGVDRVMFVDGVAESVDYLYFANYAESQKWNPGYIISSNAYPQQQVEVGATPPSQMANTHGVGWYPVSDVPQTPQTAQARACLALGKAGGAPPPANSTQRAELYGACDAALLLQTALVKSGGVGGLAAIRSAVENLGSSYVSVSGLTSATRFSADRHDGQSVAAAFAYQAGCSCFRYTTSPQLVA